MFQTLKYIFISSLYKKAKKSITMLLVYMLSLVIFSFFINDLLFVSSGLFMYGVLIFKWIVVLVLLTLIISSAIKIFNIATNPFESKSDKKEDQKKHDPKKEKILAKETLATKSNRILEKYMEASDEK